MTDDKSKPRAIIRDLDMHGYPADSPGATKEKIRQRNWQKRAAKTTPYVELRSASAFSFLNGASLPEDLVEAAATHDLGAMALIDVNGVYGAPRFYSAAKKAGVRALIGAEIVLDRWQTYGRGHELHAVPDAAPDIDPHLDAPRLTLLVRTRDGYKNLCRLLTAGALGRPKGEARYDWNLIEQHAEGLHCITGGDEGIVSRVLRENGADEAKRLIEHLHGIFAKNVHVELQRHHRRDEERRNHALIEIARSLRLPLLATNAVRYATPNDKTIHDILTCIRKGTNVDAAGRLLSINSEAHVKSGSEMLKLFEDLPEAIANSVDLASQLDFTLANLGYRFPDYPLPTGETADTFLRQITWNGARARFRPLTARAQAQIEKELATIEKLQLAGYFLIVWDIVQFCQREKILVQGRGSAANSAVCYALSITAIDPVKMDLLFERFLSEERGEWPDIDLDLPSGDQREKVIQYVYQRYGVHGAGMTANVITYREKSAAREAGKALGFSAEQIDKFAKQVGQWTFGEIRNPDEAHYADLEAAGLDPSDTRVQHLVRHWTRMQNLPRHLGQHSGGIVMAGGRLDEVVPLEPASMPGRVVIQWDKDDCADLGIIKVDLLGLGMLDAIEQMLPMIRKHERVDVDLAHLPQDDAKVFRMLNEADTVGVFQVESRAQMATLPKNAPKTFYDIVVQVAIIRPGPIVGGMVRPFFERRQGKRAVEYSHPSLEPILKRTLGVPLFQEQLLRIAMVAAGFSGGEAEELRRAMGFKRSLEKMEQIEQRLRKGMTERGIVGAPQDDIVRSITSFALYGFPESHAASFALIAYASAYLKVHHPTAFYASLLNAWPMGFYHPATLVKDAQRHGVDVRPVDVNFSGWLSSWEDGALRLGLRVIRGMREATARTIEQARIRRRFDSAEDLAARVRLRNDELTKLAEAGALASMGLTRRAALWQATKAARDPGPLFRGRGEETLPSPLPEMSPFEESLADYSTADLTTGPHLTQYLREDLNRRKVATAAELRRLPDGSRVRTAGAVIVRQRPGTAKGFVFLTLEDETGMSQAIISPQLFRKERPTIVASQGLVVEGILQQDAGQPSVKAERFWPLEMFAEVHSYDFH